MRVVSDKELRVVDRSGIRVVFLYPNEPKDLMEDMAQIALSMGAKLDLAALKTEAAEVIVVDDVPAVEDDRQERLVAVMKDILEEGNPSDFTAMNTPKAAVVNRKFGDTVLSDEREAAWKIVSED